MKTSLVVSTYNRPDALMLSLKSSLHQAVLPDEIIVADDGSTNETREVVEAFSAESKVPVIHAWQEDQGFRLARVRNLATAKASGDYIIFIDGDIVMHRNFVKEHSYHAQPKQFISGSRVFLSKELTKSSIAEDRVVFSVFSNEIKNHFNAISNSVLSKMFSKKLNHINGLRGANLSFWRSDLVEVNGFNEDFVGWGKEDSEAITRLMNNGIERFSLRFAAVAYHLYHPEHKTKEESVLEKNIKLYEDNRDRGTVYCKNGLDKHLG